MSIWATQIWHEEFQGDVAFHLDTTVINDEHPFRIGLVVGSGTAGLEAFKLLTRDEAAELRDSLTAHLNWLP